MRYEAMIVACDLISNNNGKSLVENEMTLNLLPGGNIINHGFPDSKSMCNLQRAGY